MLQSQSSLDQQTSSTIASLAIANPNSSNSVNEEWQYSNVKKSRLDKIIIQLSSWKVFIQSVLMTPSFIVPLYFGMHYIGQCPIQPLLNTFLIGHGYANLANVMLLFIAFFCAKYIRQSSNPSSYARYLLISSLIGQLVVLLFVFAWLIAGLIWVFGARSNGFQSADPKQSATYCHSTLFWNAFGDIFATYGIWLILILVLIVRFIIKRCKTKRKVVLTYGAF